VIDTANASIDRPIAINVISVIPNSFLHNIVSVFFCSHGAHRDTELTEEDWALAHY